MTGRMGMAEKSGLCFWCTEDIKGLEKKGCRPGGEFRSLPSSTAGGSTMRAW